MVSKTARWVIGGIVFLILFLLWILVGFDLGTNLLIRSQISSLYGKAKENAVREFYAEGKKEHIFAGTIAKINRRGEGGVWVWSNQGLKYLQADKYTVYSYYDVCAVMLNVEEGSFRINSDTREITTDINKWSKWADKGNFVQLIVATPEHGGQEGNLREIYAYSLPLFLSLDIGVVCEN